MYYVSLEGVLKNFTDILCTRIISNIFIVQSCKFHGYLLILKLFYLKGLFAQIKMFKVIVGVPSERLTFQEFVDVNNSLILLGLWPEAVSEMEA